MKRAIGSLLKRRHDKKVAWRRCAIMALGALCGCETVTVPPQPAPLPPDTYVPGEPAPATIYDLERLVLNMMEKLNGNVRFFEEYGRIKEKKNGALPCIVVGLLENKTTVEVRPQLRAARDSIDEWLYNSNLFDLRNDDNSIKLASEIYKEVTGGSVVEDQDFGTNSLDVFLCGDLREFPGESRGRIGYYRLRIAMVNLHTGKTLWESTQRLKK